MRRTTWAFRSWAPCIWAIAAFAFASHPPVAAQDVRPEAVPSEQAREIRRGEEQARQERHRQVEIAADPSGRSDRAHRLPPDAVTRHTVEVPRRTLHFTATPGALPITNGQGRVLAEMAYIAYALNGADPLQRPVTFAFNGGPGSASAWLHLGGLGPWRLPMNGQASSPSTAPSLVPNEETWLDFTDLVFIDPVGTGYSRVVKSGEPAEAGASGGNGSANGSRESGGTRYFWSVDGDIESISDFMLNWLQKYGRIASPKILVGESYGGFRAPKIAQTLQTRHGVGLNAIVLVSPVLDFAGRRGGRTPLSYVSLLPSLAAAAIEKRGQTPTRAALAAAEDYARGEYLTDLMRGARGKAAVDRVVAKVAQFTGLPDPIVRRYGGRIDGQTYNRETNRPEGKVASMYDASITGFDPDPTAPNPRFNDPFTAALNAPMSSAMLDLYRTKLNWRPEGRYLKSNWEANRNWIWGNSPVPPESVTELRSVLALDPRLRVLVAHGFTDLVTPYLASELILDQIPDYGGEERLGTVVYPGGHMFYSRDSSRRAFREDVLKLIERSIGGAPAQKMAP
jgi:carboxypeptidase C (cathepsin A)